MRDVCLYFDVAGMGLVPDGAAMHERPVVVCLHGGPGFDHSMLKPYLAALADVAQVVFLDHRGCGVYAVPMLRHVNLLTWKDGTEQTAVDALSGHLSGYAAEIPEIRDLSFGSDLGLAEPNVDFAIIVDCDDEEAFSRYLAHPAHGRMVGEFLKPILEARQAVQFHVSAAK